MKKKLVRLTENDLHRIVENSVRRALNELDWKTYNNLARAREKEGDFWKTRNASNAAQDAYNRDVIKPNHPKGWASRTFKDKNGEDSTMYGYINHDVDGNDFPEFNVHAGPNGMQGLGWDSKSNKTHGLDAYDYGDDIQGIRHTNAWNYPQSEDEYFGDDEGAKNDWKRMKDEFENYNNGTYEYKKGKGWKLK